MKKLFVFSVLFLAISQICLMPAMVSGLERECPTVTTLAATNISNSTATLNGNAIFPILVDLLPSPVNEPLAELQYAGTDQGEAMVSFQYGTAPGVYTNETTPVALAAPGAFQTTVIGLAPCTNYYARATLLRPIAPSRLLRDWYRQDIRGAGVGMDTTLLIKALSYFGCPDITYGNEISFKTTGCQISAGPGGSSGGFTSVTVTPPVLLSNITVQNTILSSNKVAPGETVEVTATIVNKGAVNGDSKVTLYVNGKPEESRGIVLASGESTDLHFNISRNNPGKYVVYVNGISAGNFTVDSFSNKDILIYSMIALFTALIIGLIYFMQRRAS